MATRAAGPVLVLTLLGTTLLGTQSAQAAPSDQDHDGLPDRWERRWGITDPTRRDTDRDGIPDGLEDEDADRLSNLGEQGYGTDPTNPDSDGDGRKDGAEDTDGNGTSDALEQDRRPVPAGLEPPLKQAYWDLPPSYRNGCHSGMQTELIHPCVYGSQTSDVQVALFGDSHALQWLPALDRAGKRQGWRVTALTKSACPSVEVDFQFEGVDLEPACRRWRGSARRWLKKHPQHVVIITNEGRYPLVDEKGERIYRRTKEPVWQAGLARVIDGLPKRTRAVVLADTPHLKRNPVPCLREARFISECVRRRASTLLPRHDKAERQTAQAHGAIFVDLNSVVCPYDPCPIVSGDTLMWRDESHLTATFARRLAPAVAAVIKRALERKAAPARLPSPDARSLGVVVYDDHYDPMLLEATAGEELLITVTNKGQEKHQIAFHPGEVGGDLPDAAIGPTVDPGTSATMALTVRAAGEYHYLDEAVPDGPRGRLVVGEAPASLADEPAFRTRTYAWADVCTAGLPWTGEEPLRLPGPKPRDADDVPLYRVEGKLYYRPGALAINGMKRVDAYLDTGDEAQLEQARKQARRLRRLAIRRRNAWWLPFWYDYLPAGQHAPWFNAMTQGLVLSFFTRLHHATGDEVHLEAAHRVFASFQRLGPSRSPWVAYVDGHRSLWLEHYPLPAPDHVLNAHLHAIFGIYEYWQATRSPAAERILDGAVATVRKNLPRYRQRGGISLYGLRSRTPNPKYHEIHIWQLRLLSRISGDDFFARMAAKLQHDQRAIGHVNGRPQRHDRMVVGPQCRPDRPLASDPTATDLATPEPESQESTSADSTAELEG